MIKPQPNQRNEHTTRQIPPGAAPASSAAGDAAAMGAAATATTLAALRTYAVALKAAVEGAQDLERQIRASEALPQDDVEGLVQVAARAADAYAALRRRVRALPFRPLPPAEGAEASSSAEAAEAAEAEAAEAEAAAGLGGGAPPGTAAAAAAAGSSSSTSRGGDPVPPPLRKHEAEMDGRLRACRDRLYARLGGQIHAHLRACGWPPPLVGSGAGDGPGPEEGGGDDGQGGAGADGKEGAAAAAAAAAPAPFGPEHAESAARLQRLMVALTALQRADDAEAFERLALVPVLAAPPPGAHHHHHRQGQEGRSAAADAASAAAAADASAAAAADAPILWIARELAAPLAAKLARLFDNAAPAGRLDRPGWLLNTAWRAARDAAPRVAFLQAVVESADLHSRGYHASAELARALRECVKDLLRAQKLPALADAGDRGMWLAMVDGLAGFELRLAPLLGVGPGDAAVGELPAVALRHSTLAVLVERDAWRDAWLGAEAAAASAALDAALYASEAWERAPMLAAEDAPAWRCDQWPPAAAERAASLLGALVARCRLVPTREGQERFARDVIAETLGQAHARVQRMLQQSDMFGPGGGGGNGGGRDGGAGALSASACAAAASLAWLPRVCVCVCFAHYLEGVVADVAAGPLVLALHPGGAEEGAAVALAAAAEADRQRRRRREQQQQQQSSSQGGGGGGEEGAAWGGGAPFVPGQQQQQQQQGARPPLPFVPGGGGGGGTTMGAPPLSPSAAEAAAAYAGPDPATAARAAVAARLLARPLADLTSLRREWVLRIARALSVGFRARAAQYLAPGGAAAQRFAAPGGGGGGGGGAADGNGNGADAGGTANGANNNHSDGDDVDEDDGDGVVSPGLIDGLRWLQGALAALSENLDAACFREAWRGGAAALNRSLFNGVATERRFSPSGAQQLATDVDALLRVFAPYTPRPRAHFRELAEACALLSLPAERAAGVRAAVAAAAAAEDEAAAAAGAEPAEQAAAQAVAVATAALRAAGVNHLDAGLADAVMSLRVAG